MKIRNGMRYNCSRKVGNNSAKKKRGMSHTYKTVCGKVYATENSRDRHNKQHHNIQ